MRGEYFFGNPLIQSVMHGCLKSQIDVRISLTLFKKIFGLAGHFFYVLFSKLVNLSLTSVMYKF